MVGKPVTWVPGPTCTVMAFTWTFTPFLDSSPCCRYSAATPHFLYRALFAEMA